MLDDGTESSIGLVPCCLEVTGEFVFRQKLIHDVSTFLSHFF